MAPFRWPPSFRQHHRKPSTFEEPKHHRRRTSPSTNIMAFLRQWYALVEKTLLIVFWRNWFSTLVRAFFAPIIFFFFIAYAKNFFVPPSEFGVGTPYPVRSLADAVSHGSGGRSNFVFVNNGFSGGQISEIITPISDQLSGAGLNVQTVESEGELLTVCRSSIRSVSNCFGAVTFVSSSTLR